MNHLGEHAMLRVVEDDLGPVQTMRKSRGEASPLWAKVFREEKYQPKATTLTCVLVRMVALELILEYPPPNHSLFSIIECK